MFTRFDTAMSRQHDAFDAAAAAESFSCAFNLQMCLNSDVYVNRKHSRLHFTSHKSIKNNEI